jgi:hypothetical protein
MNYEKDIRIDETALDVEWLHQPSLAMKYGRHWAELTKALSIVEENLKIVQADLTDLVNQHPEKYLGDGVKPTVGNIDSYIIRNEKYKAAKDKVREMQYEVNMANIAKMEIGNSRKTALENLVKLNGQNYFASPSMPRDLSYENAQKERQKNTDTKVAASMKRSK